MLSSSKKRVEDDNSGEVVRSGRETKRRKPSSKSRRYGFCATEMLLRGPLLLPHRYIRRVGRCPSRLLPEVRAGRRSKYL